MKTSVDKQNQQAGWRPEAWSRAVGISRATLYNFDDAIKPASVLVRRSRIITESPQAWLARMTQAQGRP